jgi:hypothetical protein
MVDEDTADRIWEARIAGLSPRKVANRLNVSLIDVKEVCRQHSNELTPEYRREMVALDLRRLQEMGKVFFRKAIEDHGADGSVRWPRCACVDVDRY